MRWLLLLLVACADRPLPLEGGGSGGVNGGGTNGGTGGTNGGTGGTNGGTGGTNGGTNGGTGGTSGGPPGTAGRPIWPPSGAVVTSRRPTFVWEGATNGGFVLCGDRACTQFPAVSFACTDPHRCTAENDLPSGVVYWKVTVPNAPDSATWELFVPPTDIGVADSHYPGPLDLDGDGVPDTAVGISGGGVGVYLGGAAGLQAAPMVLTSSDDPRNHFGYVVTAAGDLNGDGFGDLVVGECGGSGTRVYVYFGGAGGLGAKPQALDSPDGKNGFGCRVAGAGDLDADGYADLAVARVGDDFGGGLYIYRGSANGLITTTTRMDSPDQKPSRLGYSLAGLGDFDGDGFDDLAATEIDYSALTGRLHVYRGGPGGISNMQQTTRVSTDGMGLQFGASVACAGDMDRDGLPDLVVGSPAVSSTAGSPVMHVFYGGSMDEVVIQSTQAPGFAFEVEGGGDLDGDGYSDVVVSANDNVSVLLGGPTRLLTMVTAVGASAQGANPRHAAFAGDLDGDGKGDFLVADGAGVEVMLGGAGGLDRGRAMSVAAPPGGFAGAVR